KLRISNMKKCFFLFSFIGVILIAQGGFAMEIASPDFKTNTMMPKKMTCQGVGVSPNLQIHGTPASAKSFVLIVDDPDAPSGNFDHWLVYNIPPQTITIEENTIPGSLCINDARQKEWCPPCAPSGTHRYFFKIYALDCELELPADAGRIDLERAMEGHIQDKAEMVGLYRKVW
ncbi:MAG: YbhB/YbcL family Raf kinase inhibitor-like protein, partial [Candidatus Omnitrophica bacterium]|nr:YbhB/YbcL family Raf kinase inhibitor-like protein [Candidatus Omnitrophota bacterium]